ncbi:hypothetical protein Tco_1567107, partial [Tanacetum coccineum]
MANVNIPVNDAPVEQAPAVAPPTKTDDQILPISKWVPIGKSNCVLDVHKPQMNHIFPIVVALLKNTNFFRAFTTSSTISAIYIQQIWEEFVQSIQTFLTDRKNLAMAARGKKKTAHLLIPSVRFVRKDEEGGATKSSEATKVTKPKVAKVTKPADDKAPKPTATQPPKPKPAPTQPSKVVSEKKQKLVKETPDEPPAKISKGG